MPGPKRKSKWKAKRFTGVNERKGGEKGEGANLRQSGLKSVANALAAHRSPHATCNLRFAFMLLLLLLSAYVCKRVGCGLRATNGVDSIAT